MGRDLPRQGRTRRRTCSASATSSTRSCSASSDGLVERLQLERDTQKRARIYGFAGQFAGLRGVLQEFLEVTFSSSPYEADALLRGVYFVSGTQEGTPIDRVLGSIARSYRPRARDHRAEPGERPQLLPAAPAGRGRLRRKRPGQHRPQVGAAPHRRRRRRLRGDRRAQRRRDRRLAAELREQPTLRRRGRAACRRRFASWCRRTPNRASPDLLPIMPALAATRSLAGTSDEVPRKLGFGLYQGPKLDSAARGSYQRMLVDAMLPRIGLRVEEQLRQASNATETQYEALKMYLMLHDVAALRPRCAEALSRQRLGRAVRPLAHRRAARAARRPPRRAARAGRCRVAAAGGQGLDRVPSRRALPRRPCRSESTTACASRASARRCPSSPSSAPPATTRAWRSRAPAASRSPSGVPGLFTYDGYYKAFQPSLKGVADQLAAEQNWVLGVKEPPKDADRRAQGQRAAARSGAPPLPQRVRPALGPVHRRHQARADQRRDHPADPDRAPAVLGGKPAAAAHEGAVARDDAARPRAAGASSTRATTKFKEFRDSHHRQDRAAPARPPASRSRASSTIASPA